MNRETNLRVVKSWEDFGPEQDQLLIGQSYLQSVLERARQQIIDEMGHMITQSAVSKKLAICSQGETEYVEAEDILRMEASGCYTLCFLSDGRKLTVSRTLGEFERALKGRCFVRVHHSHLVNLSRVQKYHKKDGYGVRMDDGSLVPVAVRRKEEFEMKMKSMVL